MNFSKKIASLGIVSLLAAATHTNAQVIAQWTFQNDAVATNNTPATSSGTGTADSIGMNVYATPNVGITKDDVLLGVTGDTGTNTVADLTNTWRVRGGTGSSGAANGWSSAAPIGAQGAQFFVPTTSFTSGAIKVSFDWYDTSAGEANMQLEYTTNGGTSWTNLPITLGGSDSGLVALTNSSSANTVTGSYVSDNANNSTGQQDWFTGLTATINDPSALGNSGFGIEMVNASTGADDINTGGTALNNTSGNWRFDNITVSDVAAAPEPGSWALALLVALAFVGIRRVSRRSV